MIIAASDLANVIQRRIAEVRERARIQIEQGAVPDYAHYREHVGFLRALQTVDDHINELRKHKGEIGE